MLYNGLAKVDDSNGEERTVILFLYWTEIENKKA